MKLQLLFTLACAALGACANAGPAAPDGGRRPDETTDASVTPPDARSAPGTPDAARGRPDASQPGRPDAAPGIPDAARPSIDAARGGFCSTNPDCVYPDECCFVFVCVRGTENGILCFPDDPPDAGP